MIQLRPLAILIFNLPSLTPHKTNNTETMTQELLIMIQLRPLAILISNLPTLHKTNNSTHPIMVLHTRLPQTTKRESLVAHPHTLKLTYSRFPNALKSLWTLTRSPSWAPHTRTSLALLLILLQRVSTMTSLHSHRYQTRWRPLLIVWKAIPVYPSSTTSISSSFQLSRFVLYHKAQAYRSKEQARHPLSPVSSRPLLPSLGTRLICIRSPLIHQKAISNKWPKISALFKTAQT